MIQDILPQKLYNTFVRKEPSPDSRILSFREGGALYREQDGDLTFLTFRQVKEYYTGLFFDGSGRSCDGRLQIS